MLNSWDRFEVPLPFSRGVFVFGEPLYVKRKASRDAMEALRIDVENTLNALSEKAARLAEAP